MKTTKIIILTAIIFILSATNCFAFTVTAEEHETGKVILNIEGGMPPYEIYRSYDNSNYTFVMSADYHRVIEYGLEGGKTYFYKVIDDTGYEALVRYSVPMLFEQVLPLTVKIINDNQATIEWDMYDFKTAEIWLNYDFITYVYDSTTYTLNNLQPNTEYEVYIKNQYGVKSNTITFRTTNYFDKLDQLLKELVVKDLNIDSDSDGLIDKLEPIASKIDTIVNKLGGNTITGVQNVIDSVDYSTGVHDLQNLPKIKTNFRGLEITILNLDDIRLMGMMETIRLLVLAILTVTFIFLVISFFDVKFKV